MMRVVIATAALALVSCGSGRGSSTSPGAGALGPNGSISVDTDRFPHGVHTGERAEIRSWRGRGLGCADCHDAAAVREGRVARPGTDQHAPCDECHKAEFGKPPGKLCKVCHTDVDPFRKGKSPLQGYPERGAVQTLSSTFSHRLHLDRSKMEQASGAHVACADCHERSADTRDPTEGRLFTPSTPPAIPPTDAGRRELAKELVAEAISAQDAKDYDKAVEFYLRAYWLVAHPLLMFDVAQAHRLAGRVSAAKRFYERYLELDPNGQEAPTARVHLAAIENAAPTSGGKGGATASSSSPTSAREPLVPGHKVCARCHEQSAKVKAVLAMEKCAGCHPQRGVDLARGRRFITGDLKFAHATHEKDRGGAPVACTVCHAGVEVSGTREDMRVPPMVSCTQCHEDSKKSPDRVRMSNCAVCHARIESGSPPANHGSGAGGARPADHTLEFRKHHGEQAADPESKCRFCHAGVQGAREDSCFQCHSVMRPRDHNLMFRDDHGREAQADASRCGSCHAPETCAACHSIPPRSHAPLGEFRLGGHAEQARYGLSSCLTCHTYETTCSKCHRGTR